MNYRFQVSPGERGYQYEISYLSGHFRKNDARSGFLTEADAGQACLLRLMDLLESPGTIDRSLSFLDMAKIMLQGIHVSAATLKTYESRLNVWARLHDTPLQKITAGDLQGILDQYQITHSLASTQAAADLGRRVFACAEAEFQVTRFNPFAEIIIRQPADQPGDRPFAIPIAQTNGILASLEGELQLLFALLAHGGLRLAEALALHRSDIDLPADRIIVQRTKNPAGYEIPLKSPGPSRILPLPPTVRDLVLARPPTYNRRLFLEAHTPASVQLALRPHGLTMERLRRSYIQTLLDQGTGPNQAAWLSGEPLAWIRRHL